VQHPTFYRTMQTDGFSIFYREAGPKDARTLLLLHGLPSSSRRTRHSTGHGSGYVTRRVKEEDLGEPMNILQRWRHSRIVAASRSRKHQDESRELPRSTAFRSDGIWPNCYIERGSGERGLFDHGLPLNGFHWRGVIECVAGFRRCIVPDLMGLGYTDVSEARTFQKPCE
jgi:pimeloyl-ACP methyl ester carboxylesterase